MNTERWDEIGRQWLYGALTPANGLDAWRRQAHAEADLIASILHDPDLQHSAATLVEIGCGVGRLTPLLAPYFHRVIATDTSSVMLGLTAAAAGHWQNVEVATGLYPNGDAALVWGNLYDEDWSLAAQREHVRGLLEQFPLVLVQGSPTSERFAGLGFLRTGADWALLEGKPGDALL